MDNRYSGNGSITAYLEDVKPWQVSSVETSTQGDSAILLGTTPELLSAMRIDSLIPTWTTAEKGAVFPDLTANQLVEQMNTAGYGAEICD